MSVDNCKLEMNRYPSEYSTKTTLYCVQCKRYVFIPHSCQILDISRVDNERLERIEKVRLERMKTWKRNERICDAVFNGVIFTFAIFLLTGILYRCFFGVSSENVLLSSMYPPL